MLGLSPVRVFRNLGIHDLNGDFLGNRKAAVDRGGLGQNSADIPRDFGRITRFRVDFYTNSQTPVSRRPISARRALIPHCLHFSVLSLIGHIGQGRHKLIGIDQNILAPPRALGSDTQREGGCLNAPEATGSTGRHVQDRPDGPVGNLAFMAAPGTEMSSPLLVVLDAPERAHAGHRTKLSRNVLMTGRVQGRQLKDQIPFGVGYRAGCQYNDLLEVT
jgi:hypothetical protein